MYTYTNACIYIWIYACAHICIYIYICIHIHIDVRIEYTHKYVHICIIIHICIHIYTCTYTHIHVADMYRFPLPLINPGNLSCRAHSCMTYTPPCILTLVTSRAEPAVVGLLPDTTTPRRPPAASPPSTSSRGVFLCGTVGAASGIPTTLAGP